MTSVFIDNLKMFNRKERFHVVQEATKNGFELDSEFKHRIENILKITIPDKNVFVAMDYHFDWIGASLFLCNQSIASRNEGIFLRDVELIQANQEDVDLLIAAPDVDNPMRTNLIMIEAKADTSWSNGQTESKGKRLRKIFELDPNKQIVQPFFLIWSPTPPVKLKHEFLPDWVLINNKVPHLQLTMDDNLAKVTCCDEKGKDKSRGTHWKVAPIKDNKKRVVA